MYDLSDQETERVEGMSSQLYNVKETTNTLNRFIKQNKFF